MLWAAVVAVSAGVGVLCLLGHVEHSFSAQQILGTGVVGRVALPALVTLGTGELQTQLLEDGAPIGPRVADPQTVRRLRGGSYSVRPGGWLPPSPTRLYFSASDRSRPRFNGRRYTVRYPRRQLPASWLLVAGCWAMLPLIALRCSTRAPGSARGPVEALPGEAWALVVIGGLYTSFAVQAWLGPPNITWFVAFFAVALPFLFRRLASGPLDLPGWSPWIAGILLWAAATVIGGSSYASATAAAVFAAVSAGGFGVYLATRGSLERTAWRWSPLLALFALTVAASLTRDAGFDLAGGFAAFGLGEVWRRAVVNPWTTKFLAHWILVVAWCSLVAVAVPRGDGARQTVVIGLVTASTLVLNGSRSGIVALFVSAAVACAALRWPRPVRRLLVYGTVGCILAAPLLFAVPWQVRSRLGDRLDDRVATVLDVDQRAGKWEYARRLVALRPLQGWGFGGSASLPGRATPVDQALGVEASAGGTAPPRYPVLAGGHPHNAALLTWLDLGLIGALLVAGLLVQVGRSIATLEKERSRHAAILGLLAATTFILALNYPVWEPEVASILWLSVALAASPLSVSPPSRREIFRGAAIVALILALGGILLVQQRLSLRSVSSQPGPGASHGRSRSEEAARTNLCQLGVSCRQLGLRPRETGGQLVDLGEEQVEHGVEAPGSPLHGAGQPARVPPARLAQNAVERRPPRWDHRLAAQVLDRSMVMALRRPEVTLDLAGHLTDGPWPFERELPSDVGDHRPPIGEQIGVRHERTAMPCGIPHGDDHVGQTEQERLAA